MESNRMEIDISVLGILKVVAVLAIILFLVAIREILLLFYVVLIIVAAISPVVDSWSKKMSRPLAIALIYIIIFAIIAVIILIIFPPLISQVGDLTKFFPQYSKEFSNLNLLGQGGSSSSSDIPGSVSQAYGLANQLFSATKGVVSGLVGAFTIIVLSFYLLLEQHGTKKFLVKYLPTGEREALASIAQKIGSKMGSWMRGQLLLGLIIGVIDGIGLALLGVPFVLTLAVWAGFTELIPYVGPILGAIPGVILAYLHSPILGVLALALYVIVQQLEGNFLVPKIMQKAVGLSPVIIILAMLIGAKLYGILGVLLAIPTAVIIDVLVAEWPSYSEALGVHYRKITKTK